MTDWFDYDAWDPTPTDTWIANTEVLHPHEVDPHIDLGCGTIRKGRIGIDHHDAPGVGVVMDLDTLFCRTRAPEPNTTATGYYVGLQGLPFPDSSIRSAISHHACEHIGPGFVELVDEIWRVLEPGGVFRAITPLFPSRTAVEDPDHVRMFMEGTWETFCGKPGPGGHWHEAFSVPYMKSRFTLVDKTTTPMEVHLDDPWGPSDAREIRVSLVAEK